MFANVRSITKREELELYADKEILYIFGIAGSWTNPEIENSELALDGTRLFRVDGTSQ